MRESSRPRDRLPMDRRYKDPPAPVDRPSGHPRGSLPGSEPLRQPVPGALFRWVKLASWLELCLFASLLFFWIAPGYEHQTSLFGLAHGLGYLALCALIFVAIVRREAPWPLLAATLTPAGPAGSVIGIELIERRGWGIDSAGIDTTRPNRG
jgi:hypothetical protein